MDDKQQADSVTETPEVDLPAGYGNITHVVVPIEPTEKMWGGLARDLISWHSFGSVTPRALFQHLEYSGKEIPQWLRDEPEMKHLDHVPSAGTRAVLIFRAMIAAAGEQG